MAPIHIKSESEYSKHINGSQLVVVDFYATWCGPCKVVAPRFEQLASKYPNVVFLKVDVDEQQGIARTASVTAMPTFHLYRGGKRLAEVVGADIGKVESLTAQYASGGGGKGGPASFPSGGRVLGTGAPANEPAQNSNMLMWGVMLAVVGWMWWNNKSDKP
ncbi:thioredoxin-like protein [Phlyctochytrium arcticum]|nr:thioredoxin-like protein [Phlyctochytrium arcticum]